jgi:eukaryotic-like serine/threonine-protein kinase
VVKEDEMRTELPQRDLELRPGPLIHSPINGTQYRVSERLGAGGFGVAYRVAQLTGPRPLRRDYCLKITANQTAWHREAYFGDLMKEVPGVIRVYESFVWLRGGNGKPLYCLKTELAEGGDLASWLDDHREPWKEARATREIIRLLRTVKLLHESGAVHRDITPGNVFVMSNRVLKLGDFGIALHRVGVHDVSADVFAPWFAPSGMGNLGKTTWRPADDVYHLGQLFAILLCGCATSKLTARDVKRLSCSPEAKSIIQRSIGVRRKRFPNAAVMLNALEKHDSKTIKRAIVRSLKDKRVVFTGRLSIKRADAERLVKKAGGLVERRVGHQTNVLVVGRQSPIWKADSKGQKLLDTDREREFGRNIPMIGEKCFLTLAGVVPH